MNNNYWNLLNHLPSNQVNNIVTPLVLRLDKRSCDNLLKEILKEKREEDEKKNLMQKERTAERNKLKFRHNERISLAQQIGIKVKNASTTKAINQIDY